MGLYIDGTRVKYADITSLAAGWAISVTDASNDPLSAGTHTFKVLCDYNNEVSESNEGNNEYSRTFKITKSPPGPEISSINPYKGSAGTGTEVTITGEGFGATAGNGKVEFWYGRGYPGDPDRIEAPIVSWSDTQIVCEVPAAILNDYPASAGSGPLRVVTDEGGVSNEVTFIVTFSYMGVMWDNLYSNPEVPYRINENTSDCTGEGAAVRSAAETWNNAGAVFSFRYAGTHNNTETGENGYNDIMWSNNVRTGILAYASTWSVNGIITEADIAYNDKDCQWSSGNNPGSNEFDIQSILIHELGHWLSLRDLYGDIGDGVNDIGKVMYGRAGSGEMMRNLHSNDIAGIRWIYGASYSPAMPWIPLLLFED
jgi:hypothetical protein